MKTIKLKIGDEVQIDPNRSTKCEKCGAKVWLAEHKIGIIRIEEIAKGVYQGHECPLKKTNSLL